MFKRYSLAIFFIVVFLVPWLVWGTTIAQQHRLLTWHIPQPLAFWLGITSAVYIAAALSGGKNAVKDLLARIVRVRLVPKWYLFAVLFIPTLATLALGIWKLAGGEIVIGREIATSSLPLIFLIEFWLFLMTEETAWRGFVLPRLQKHVSPLVASLFLGAIWALWHLPLFYISGSFQSSLPFFGFFISTIATAITMTWLFNATRGSVFIAAIFHAATDVAIGYLGVMSGSQALFWLFVTLQLVAALWLGSRESMRHRLKTEGEIISNL